MSKKPFLLFELLIALSLMGVLLSFLFSFMMQSIKVEKKMEAARDAMLERQHLHARLQDLFTSLVPNGAHPALYTLAFPREEKESLIAFFDHGIDVDPAFSGPLVGRIYVDEQKNLCLAYWPTSKENDRSWRKEILLQNISDLSWFFLGTPATWSPRWPKESHQLPWIVRLTMQQKNQPIVFAFSLPSANPIIVYERKI